LFVAAGRFAGQQLARYSLDKTLPAEFRFQDAERWGVGRRLYRMMSDECFIFDQTSYAF
jgi:hypothetical protein